LKKSLGLELKEKEEGNLDISEIFLRTSISIFLELNDEIQIILYRNIISVFLGKFIDEQLKVIEAKIALNRRDDLMMSSFDVLIKRR
jgi:hypothetical protein